MTWAPLMMVGVTHANQHGAAARGDDYSKFRIFLSHYCQRTTASGNFVRRPAETIGVDFGNPISDSTIMLGHETGYEQPDVFSFRVGHDDPRFNTRRRVRIFNVEFCSQHSSGFGFDPESSVGI